MVESGAYYIILDFDKIEGFFIPPCTDRRFSTIGLKLDSLPERRRFSAAHELCHHLKDYDKRLTKQGTNDETEIFANKFATHLLMPDTLVNEVINELGISKDTDLEKILKFSVRFAVSFQSAFIRVNDVLNWNLDTNTILKKSRRFKPQKKKDLLIQNTEYTYKLYKEIIENYFFIKFKSPAKVRNDFLKFVVTHDHLIENGKVSRERISEIVSLLRLYPPSHLTKRYEFKDEEREVIGQYMMYDYIFNNQYTNNMDALKKLHEKFCAVASFPEYGGRFRNTAAYIKGTNVIPAEHHLIEIELIDLFNKYDFMEENLSNIEIINRILWIHHGITVIHPFSDGNGRISRALMNFQLIAHNISPFFISYEKFAKNEYYKGLQLCDKNDNITQLETYTYKNIIEMYSKLIGPR